MVDSKAKGARAELKMRDELRTLTGLKWERVPMSGGLSANHKLKGDLYVPDHSNKYCVEVKHYADDHLTSKILTDKTPQWFVWWEQTLREAYQVEKKPCLIYRFDRSKSFVAFESTFEIMSQVPDRWMYLGEYEAYTMRLESWIKHLKPEF